MILGLGHKKKRRKEWRTTRRDKCKICKRHLEIVCQVHIYTFLRAHAPPCLYRPLIIVELKFLGTIDLSSSNPALKKGKKKKKQHVEVALEFSQKSTASMGKFDNKLKYEPAIKKKSKPKVITNFHPSKHAKNDVL